MFVRGRRCIAACALLLAGCGSPDRPVNRSFPTTYAKAVAVHCGSTARTPAASATPC